MQRGFPLALSVAVAAIATAVGPAALAAPAGKAVEGVVIRLQDDEVVVDIGSKHGVPSDARLRVYRRLVVQHPLTGKKIEDRFPIGEVPLAERGELLSIIRDLKGLD